MDIFSKKYGAGILIYCITTNRFLLCKRGPKSQNEPNKWAHLGGKCNPYETPFDTAIREFYEESGVILPIRLKLLQVYKKDDGFEYHNFLGLVDGEFTPKVNVETVDFEVEVSDYKWLTLKELLNFDKNKLHWGMKLLFKNVGDELKKIDDKYTK